MRVAAYYPNHFQMGGICYAAISILEEMQSKVLQVSMMGISSDKELRRSFYKDAIPSWAKFFAYKAFPGKKITKITEALFLHSLKPAQPVYLWPGASLDLHEKIHSRGHRIVMESVNTHQANSKAIQDAEYARLGLPANHGVVDEETAKLKFADFVFSCSPLVKASLVANNFSAEKILDTTYGLKQSEIFTPAELEKRSKHKEFTVIFVGTIGVRKGPHLLLDYWCRSKIKGKLRLVGHIQSEVRHIIEPYLKRADIEHVPFVSDLRPIYQDADVFALPSLEEGSPLVTYLALGAGLPSIVSPMGGGGVIENEKSGIVIDEHDDIAWIEALKRLSEEASLRESFSQNAYRAAPDYVWAEVGRKRAEVMLAALSK